MSEDRLEEALRRLRRADRNVEPGEGAEVCALLAFRRQRRSRQTRRTVLAIAAAAAVFGAMFAVVFAVKPAPRALELTQAIPAPPSPPPFVLKPVKQQQPREEVATPFYPLMPSSPPLESAMLVRVTVEASALRSVGIPVSDDHLNDPVQADVLVGQDDLPRAIRFVSYR